ncbi:MAG: hypothetical protein U0163_05455 [Gemmatimonadaceae bacterium]
MIRDQRNALIARLDSNARALPAERWMPANWFGTPHRRRPQRRSCRRGKALSRKGGGASCCWASPTTWRDRYVEADTAYARALALMDERDRCEWRDLKLLLDDELLKDYRETRCPSNSAFENWVVAVASDALGSPGNDARTEYYSRVMYTKFLEDGPSVHLLGFDEDDDEREPCSATAGRAPGREDPRQPSACVGA